MLLNKRYKPHNKAHKKNNAHNYSSRQRIISMIYIPYFNISTERLTYKKLFVDKYSADLIHINCYFCPSEGLTISTLVIHLHPLNILTINKIMFIWSIQRTEDAKLGQWAVTDGVLCLISVQVIQRIVSHLVTVLVVQHVVSVAERASLDILPRETDVIALFE